MDRCGKRVFLGLAAFAVGLSFFPFPLPAQNDEFAAPASASSSPSQDAPPDTSFQTFYDSLANQGTWIQNPDYGYVWQPTIDNPDWAPYTEGHWAYTDDGWTWISDESWGWATYHYGRWVNLDGTGWCWVPGYTWAPAWVSWRYGDGYAGWAPLPPDSLIGVDYAPDANVEVGDQFHIGGDCDSYYGIGAGWYNFLPIAYLGDSNYRGFYAHRYDNYRLLNQTRNVTNLNVDRRSRHGNFHGATLDGPSLLQVNAHAQTPIRRLGLAYTNRVGGGAVEGGSIALFAPRIDVASLQGARPQGNISSLAHAEINRGTNLSRPLSVNARLAGVVPTDQQLRDAQAAQASAPATAREAGPNSPVRSHIATSFTSMRPVGLNTAERSTAAQQQRGFPDYSNGAQLYRRPENYPYRQDAQRVVPGRIYSRPSTSYPMSSRPAAAATPASRAGAVAPAPAPAPGPANNSHR